MQPSPSILVIIPTYNERENLALLVEAILGLGIPNLSLLVVDDNSPDGTGALANELSHSYPLRVLHRPRKEGLGAAYAAAFRAALANDPPDLIVQMDADFSHDPAAIPDLIGRASECDLVLGSRYVSGGRIENWGWLRRGVSRWGNAYARRLLVLPYRDLTGGFKCWQRPLLASLPLGSMSSQGYNFQIETTFRAHCQGATICEVPIVFAERRRGSSKMNLEVVWESVWKLFRLRRENPRGNTSAK